MKRIYSFMVATVALVAAVSCNKEFEQENIPAGGQTVVYTATVDQNDEPEAKAVLDQTTKKSKWTSTDAITVLDGDGAWTFTSTGEGENVDFENAEGFGDYRPVMAVYPAEYDNHSYTVNVSEKTVSAYIPTWQQARLGTYQADAAVAVAYSETNSFAFKNATALLKFTVATDNVTHVIFHGNDSEAITGNVTITLGQDGVSDVKCEKTEFKEQQWNEELQKNEDVTVSKYGTWVECYAWDDNELKNDSSDDTKYFTKDKPYYIAVAPQVFNSGVTAKIRIDEGQEIVVKTTSERVETKANTILNIKELKYVAPSTVETVYLQPGVWNVDGAWFAAHFFNSTGGAEDIKMTDADGVYEVAVPDGMESVIFCRMNPAFEVFSWDDGHVWDKTDNLSIPLEGDTKVYYNVTDWKAGEWSDTPQEITPDQPEDQEKDWGIVGLNGDWNTNVEMTLVDGWYVAHNVTIKTSDGFKFRVGTTWDEIITYTASTIEANTEYSTVNGAGSDNDMKVAVSAIYSVYLSEDASMMKIVKTDDLPNVSVPDQDSDWAVAGSFNDWQDSPMVTTTTPDLFVVKSVTLAAYAEFKIKKKFVSEENNGWGTSYGVKAVNYINPNVWISVQLGSATNISVVSAGTYDIYFDKANERVYVVTAGGDFTSATEQTVSGEEQKQEEPEVTSNILYLAFDGVWQGNNERFAAYFFNSSEEYAWVSMSDSDNDNIYEVNIPKGYTFGDSVIFCRMNGSTTSNSWTNKWNQTGNLTIPTDGKNLYTVNSWDGCDNLHWSTK